MLIKPHDYVTADTHFGHIKMVEVFNKRKPTHNEDMVAGWNKLVAKQDRIFVLGDLTMARKDITRQWTDHLRGSKYLIGGNHDGQSPGWYADLGFTLIPDAYEVYRRWDVPMPVLFTHEPVIPLPAGWFNIHGHLHGDNHRNIHTSNYHYDVGVEASGMKPIKVVDILTKFQEML